MYHIINNNTGEDLNNEQYIEPDDAVAILENLEDRDPTFNIMDWDVVDENGCHAEYAQPLPYFLTHQSGI